MLTSFLFFSDFIRMYAVRRIRDAFRENKSVKDPVEIQALVNKAKRDLEIIRRQVRWFSDRLLFIMCLQIWHYLLDWTSLLWCLWFTPQDGDALSSFLVQTCKDELSFHKIQGHLTGECQLSETSRAWFFWETKLFCFTKVDALSVRNWGRRAAF